MKNGLDGTIPSEISPISSLANVILEANPLRGPLPSSLTRLTHLTSLFVGESLLTGQIPEDIGRLTKLTGLGLGGNQFTGTLPVSIGRLTVLERLLLGDNRFSGTVPTNVGTMTRLSQLLAENNEFEGALPSEMASMTQLHTMDFSYNDITSGAEFLCQNGVELRHYRTDCYSSAGELEPEVTCDCCTDCCHDVLSICLGGESQRFEAAATWLVAKNVTHPTTLRSPGSAQYQALIWLADVDSLQVDLSVASPLAQERYALAVLYFSTTGPNSRWENHIQFLTDDSVCNWGGFNPDTGTYSGVQRCNEDGSVEDIYFCTYLGRNVLGLEA